MPTSLLDADTAFPTLTGSDSEKIEKITNYLYMLLEQLRYSMANLGTENFNDTELDKLQKIITDPVYVQLKDTKGNISALQAEAASLQSRIGDAEGNLTSLTQTAQALTTRVTGAEGDISTLTQTAVSLESRISGAEGSVSTISQTLNGMRLQVTNGESSSSIQLLANGVAISSQNITFTGAVTFADLTTSGRTQINGANITTGTISAIDITGSTITASKFNSLLNSDGTISGELDFYYLLMRDGYMAGTLRLDDQGAGTATESRYRLMLETKEILGVPFVLKFLSAGGMSLESKGDMWLIANAGEGGAAKNINISSTGRINLTATGGVYVNGTKI